MVKCDQNKLVVIRCVLALRELRGKPDSGFLVNYYLTARSGHFVVGPTGTLVTLSSLSSIVLDLKVI